MERSSSQLCSQYKIHPYKGSFRPLSDLILSTQCDVDFITSHWKLSLVVWAPYYEEAFSGNSDVFSFSSIYAALIK